MFDEEHGSFLCIIPYLKAWGPCGYPFSSHIDVPSSRLHGWLPYHIPNGMFPSMVGDIIWRDIPFQGRCMSVPPAISTYLRHVCMAGYFISSPRGCFC